MLGHDEMQEYEEARAAAGASATPPAFALAWFSLWLAMLSAMAGKR